MTNLTIHSRRTVLIPLLIASTLSLLLQGCTIVEFVELREKPRNPITKRLTLSSYGDAGPSRRTQTFLKSSGYHGGEDYLHMLRHCRTLSSPANKEAQHATAELGYLAAEDTRKHDPGLAMELYFDSVQICWQYLTSPDEFAQQPDVNAIPHRQTTELYNTCLEQLLRLTRSSGHYQLGCDIRLPVSGRMLNVEVPFPTQWISKDQLGDFEFVSNYELKNLRNRHTNPGLGVPIMVRRRRQQATPELEEYYEDRLSLPVTVVARSSEAHPNAGMRLQLLDPRESDGVIVNDTLLPLESDLSTPLAWFLTDPKKSLLDTFAFLRPDKAKSLEGLYMTAPYDPERIPVLMVHGLWSSPVTWMEMFNDLQSDPQLRDKYQFWFYMYPTGEPLTFAAANLRDRLQQMRARCDPQGRNPKLDQMVVVGHSMGGLMSYLLTVNSDDKLWNALSHLPVEQIRGDEQVQHQIRRVFFFEPDTAVDRIVTIASPFNGSGYANRFTQWLSGSIVSLPNTTSRLSQLIFRQNNHSVWNRMFAPRTSLDSLNKNSAVIKLISQTTTPDVVRHHNVIGVSSGSSLKDWTDGVVRKRSASRPDADTEIEVVARHSEVHRHPDTIQEVRRILIDHLEDLRQRKYPVVPISGTATPPVTAAHGTTVAP